MRPRRLAPEGARRRPPRRGPPARLAAGLVAALGLCPGAAQAFDPDAPHPARARLLADHAAVAPGQAARLMLRLDLDPGWHVYWTNPGDGGLPTEVTPRLPEGWRFSPPRWPAPARFEEAGGVTAFGYDRRVDVPLEVQVPRSARVGTRAPIEVVARWLVCEEVCLPGEATLSGVLPVEARPRPWNHGAFQAAAARAPVPASAPDSPATVEVEGSWSGAAPGPARFTLTARWRADPGEVDWIPGPGEGLEASLESLETRGLETTAVMEVRLFSGRSPPAEGLETVLTFSGSGGRRGVRVDLPPPPP